MEWFIAVVAIVSLGVAALVATGGLGQMSVEPVRDLYHPDLPAADQPLGAADISALRFGVTLRGYAMNQVDDVLARLATEIAERDALIESLRPAENQTAPGEAASVDEDSAPLPQPAGSADTATARPPSPIESG